MYTTPIHQIREAAANAPMAERERPFYEEEELEPPRPGSGLGFVHIDRIPKQDVPGGGRFCRTPELRRTASFQ